MLFIYVILNIIQCMAHQILFEHVQDLSRTIWTRKTNLHLKQTATESFNTNTGPNSLLSKCRSRPEPACLSGQLFPQPVTLENKRKPTQGCHCSLKSPAKETETHFLKRVPDLFIHSGLVHPQLNRPTVSRVSPRVANNAFSCAKDQPSATLFSLAVARTLPDYAGMEKLYQRPHETEMRSVNVDRMMYSQEMNRISETFTKEVVFWHTRVR